MSQFCSTCNLVLKSKYNLRIHVKSKRHIDRTQSEINNKFVCSRCRKTYATRQSIHVHMKSCVAVVTEVHSPTCSIQDQLQQQIKDMKEAFENERQTLKDELEAMRTEILKINKQKEEKKTTTALPVHTKRRKINKELRQKIAIKQENACGSCKLALTPYFQIDHTVGLQFGGTDEESNLMALCCECHAMKSIAENQCRKQIHEAIQTILTDKLGQRG